MSNIDALVAVWESSTLEPVAVESELDDLSAEMMAVLGDARAALNELDVPEVCRSKFVQCRESLRRLEGLLRHFGSSVGLGVGGYSAAETRVRERLVISLEPPQAVLDGRAYALTEQGAMFLDAVVAAEGNWVTGGEIAVRHSLFDSQRIKRIKDRLPGPLVRLVESAPGRGSRLRVADLA